MTVKDHDSIKQLFQLSQSIKDTRWAFRVQAVAMAKQGHSSATIARFTGHSQRGIQRWVGRYNRQGVDGLADRPRVGRPVKLSVDQVEQLRARLDGAAPGREPTATLYGRDIQRILREEQGVLYSLNGVYKLLHRLGYSWLMPRPRHEQADPQAVEAFKKTSAPRSIPSPHNTPARRSKSGSKTKPASANRVR